MRDKRKTHSFLSSLYTFFLLNSIIAGFLWEPLLCPQDQAVEFVWPGHGCVHVRGGEGAFLAVEATAGETAEGGGGVLECSLQSLGWLPAVQKLRNHLSQG